MVTAKVGIFSADKSSSGCGRTAEYATPRARQQQPAARKIAPASSQGEFSRPTSSTPYMRACAGEAAK